jgi:hypothetical protein
MNQQLLSDLTARLRHRGGIPEILTANSPGYDARRQIFNNLLQFRPAAIVLVENALQVSTIVIFANDYPLEVELKVRSGGHDHEGECTATDALLIDFTKMNDVRVDGDIVAIEPGARFRQIKPVLDAYQLGIPHGTCETVCATGFTLGGGWGPWTRRYGMGCEHLVGADIVLGDGEWRELREGKDPEGSPEAELLWALRGGGGFSYGIVTTLYYQAFRLPDDLCSFNLHCEVEWPHRSAVDIIKCWENAIAGDQNEQLVGTNLKVVAKHLEPGREPDPEAILECVFNGYFAGTEDQARKMIEHYFGATGPLLNLAVQVHRGPEMLRKGANVTPEWHFESWDRHLPSQARQEKHLLQLKADGSADDFHPGIILEDDGPAPHKITSRLADPGWDDESRRALVCSLQSRWVPTPKDLQPDGKKNDFPINNYITLGAITGPYYANYGSERHLPSAFPYKKRLFTIQYQVWWDQYLNPDWQPVGDTESRDRATLDNRGWANRAQDWIDACRAYAIPNTGGAFISFKDSAVLTETYFSESYQKLKEVKLKYSRDRFLLFRSRKTIV